MDFKAGLFSAIKKISINGNEISLTGRHWFKYKTQKFNLKEVTSVKLLFMFSQSKGMPITVAGITKQFSYQNKMEAVSWGDGGTLVKPIPTAVFFKGEKPLFFIDYFNSEKFIGALVEISKIIGEKKFDDDLKKLINAHSKELEIALRLERQFNLMYVFLMIIFMVGGFVVVGILRSIISPINVTTYVNPIFMFLIIFSGIVAAALPIIVIDYFLKDKKSDRFMQNNPKLFRSFSKKVNTAFLKIVPIAFIIYLISIFGFASNYIEVNENGLDEYLYFVKINESKFSDVTRISIYCAQDDGLDSPNAEVRLDSINGPLIYRDDKVGLPLETAKMVIEKTQHAEYTLDRCYINSNPKIQELIDLLNIPIELTN